MTSLQKHDEQWLSRALKQQRLSWTESTTGSFAKKSTKDTEHNNMGSIRKLFENLACENHEHNRATECVNMLVQWQGDYMQDVVSLLDVHGAFLKARFIPRSQWWTKASLRDQKICQSNSRQRKQLPLASRQKKPRGSLSGRQKYRSNTL